MSVTLIDRAVHCFLYITAFTYYPLLCIAIYTEKKDLAIAGLFFFLLEKSLIITHNIVLKEKEKQELYELEEERRNAKAKAMDHIRQFIQVHGGNPCDVCHHDAMTCVDCQGFANFEVTALSLNRLQDGE